MTRITIESAMRILRHIRTRDPIMRAEILRLLLADRRALLRLTLTR